MLHEHAVTYQGRLTMADLDYIVRKSNKLGCAGRHVIRVSQEIDPEGTHVFFEVTGLSESRRIESKI